jgi:hypothetical protein
LQFKVIYNMKNTGKLRFKEVFFYRVNKNLNDRPINYYPSECSSLIFHLVM